MTSITVFTPTYNRAHLLPQLYKSLSEQTNKTFCWLIIDDGSSDETKALVKTWQQESLFEIEYHYQVNQGMVAAHNTAHYIMNTDLCVCIDFDDYMPYNGIDNILKLWEEYGNENCAGLIGLDAYPNQDIVGDKFPKDNWECKFSDLEANKIFGDKKFVHNRKVFNQFLPYPRFGEEKFPVTSYLYFFIEQKYNYRAFNNVFCIVEYQMDGLSNNLIKQYRESPLSFAHYRKIRMKYAINYKFKIKNTIHYISSMLLAKKYNIIKESPSKLITLLTMPLGFLLYLYIKQTKNTSINKNLNKK